MIKIEQTTESGNNEFSNNVVDGKNYRFGNKYHEKLASKIGKLVGMVLVTCVGIIIIIAALVVTTIFIRFLFSLLN